MADTRSTFVPHDPPASSQFVIEVDGIAEGFFSQCDGLEVEQEMVEYRFSDEMIIRKRPGLVKYGDITLKGGWINTDLEDWIMNFRPGAGVGGGVGDAYLRKSIAIIMQDYNGEPMRRWNLHECHPKKWKVSGFDSNKDDVVIQELTFSVEWWEPG